MRSDTTFADPPTIMNKALPPCSNPTVKTTTIQDSDAVVAHYCVQKAEQIHDSTPVDSGGGDYQISGWISYNCVQIWDVYDIYYWNDGWHYSGSVYVRAEIECY
jgi:hypothetical protein